jgi:hypothetical protein
MFPIICRNETLLPDMLHFTALDSDQSAGSYDKFSVICRKPRLFFWTCYNFTALDLDQSPRSYDKFFVICRKRDSSSAHAAFYGTRFGSMSKELRQVFCNLQKTRHSSSGHTAFYGTRFGSISRELRQVFWNLQKIETLFFRTCCILEHSIWINQQGVTTSFP